MSMLSGAQIEGASVAELVATARAISSYLDGLEEAAVLETARVVLVAHGLSARARVTMGVDEWDDGYFFSGVEAVEDERGNTLVLPDAAITALELALEEPLTELSRNGPSLGRFARCTIDLVAGTLGR